MNAPTQDAIRHWSHVAPLLSPPRSEAAYRRLVEALDAVLDAGGADEAHPLARLADYLSSKRKLNVRQIAKRSARFHLPADACMP